MRNYVYFWIEKFRSIGGMSQKTSYLFDDYAVNLSSKYRITHKWSKKKRIFSFQSFSENENMIACLEDNFYSKNIIDLKVLLGDNGAGKSSIMELLSDIISGKDSHSECTYILVWEENGKFQYYLQKGRLYKKNKGGRGISEIKDQITVKSHPIFQTGKKNNVSTILYSSAFPNYWNNLDFEGRYTNCYDIRTKTLLIEDVDIINNGVRKGSTKDNLICFSKEEENKIVDFVLDFYDAKIKGKPFLANTISFPSVLLFVLSKENINNGIREIAQRLRKNDQDETRIVKEFKVFFNSLTEFEDQIKLACILNAFRTKVFSVASWKKVDMSVFTIDNIRNLDDFLKKIHIYLNARCFSKLYEKVVRLIECIRPFCIQNNWNSLEPCCYIIQIGKSKESINEIRKILHDIEGTNRIMDMEWGRPLSSGESSYLTFFGRLYSCLKDYKENKDSFYNRNGNEFQGCLFLDELDLYLHPEWQRMWFAKFIDGLSLLEEKLKMPMRIQLFIATHSPFMVTDFASESIVTLQREKRLDEVWGPAIAKSDVLKKTMAGNIYDILDSGFIVGGTLGYFIERRIKELLKRIEEKKCTANDEKFVKQIGDPIIQSIISNRMRP